MAGIYIHIPYCNQACHYCDFHFSTNRKDQRAMVAAISRELELQRDYLKGEPIQTIYLGGGTPSILDEDELHLIFSVLRKEYQVESKAEVTLEANPEDLTLKKLTALKNVGVNRLSIGIQSFDDTVLQFLNRNHTAQQSQESVRLARSAGFKNISLDLIFAIPGQSSTQLIRNVELTLALQPEHISAYSLTIEPKTVFGNWFEKGRLVPAGDDVAASEMTLVADMLTKGGYEQYEVSNFCKPGFRSRHNSSYWRQENYLGVGPGAHSYNGSSRQFNVKNNPVYIRSLQQDIIPFEKENLSDEDKVNEYILTTLRTNEGCNLSLLSTRFHYDMTKENKLYLDKLSEEGLIVLKDEFLRLTPAGRLVADKISSDLFLAT